MASIYVERNTCEIGLLSNILLRTVTVIRSRLAHAARSMADGRQVPAGALTSFFSFHL